MGGRFSHAVSAAVVWRLAGGLPLAAQTGATVDVGFAGVRYDGFLPSTGASVSPELRLDRGRLLLSARGTFLRFQSGNQSLQANIAASYFTPLPGRWRAELTGHAGASRYADFASFSHLVLGPRVHLAGQRAGIWLGGSAGTTSLVRTRRSVWTLAAGAWARRFDVTWLASLTTTRVGDTTYFDIAGGTHADRGRLTIDASVGLREFSRGGGHGVHGEASAAFDLRAWLALVVSGGRYPTDPIRGSVSGRYLGIALRLTPLLVGRAKARPAPLQPTSTFHTAGVDLDDRGLVSVEVRPCRCAGRTLVVHAGEASNVEVSGDFTDWEPVSLAPGEGAIWTVTLPLAPGTYRFNIRMNGGAWVVPLGVTQVADEFGGTVGLLTVR
jgi:hypothetical protein